MNTKINQEIKKIQDDIRKYNKSAAMEDEVAINHLYGMLEGLRLARKIINEHKATQSRD